MARTTDDLLTAIERFLPPEHTPLRPLTAGRAAQMSLVEGKGDVLARTTKVGGAYDMWLTLLAHGYGIDRATDETDGSLRKRIRSPEEQLTIASIEEVANRVLRYYGGTDCILIEHWSHRVYCAPTSAAHGTFCGHPRSVLFDEHNAFTLLCPTLAGGLDHVAYGQIVAAVDRVRSSGVRWWLLLDDNLYAALGA